MDSDLISKADVLRIINFHKRGRCSLDWAYSAICELPTVEPVKWIPCSERFPTKEEYLKCNGQFIVSDGDRTYGSFFDIYDTLRFGDPTIDYFRVDRRVVAWMLPPEPYKAGDIDGQIDRC